MTLNQALTRRNNNFDLLRLIAACAVIVGHAHALVLNDTSSDAVADLLGFDYSGSLAVKFFFFLSGLVVTNSLIEKPRAIPFAIARLCRLMPGLIVCVLLSALILGPLVSSLTPRAYFADVHTWTYIKANISLRPQWDLPGVFLGHRNLGVNGSLWTLPIEVFCYLVLAAFGFCGTFRYRSVGSAVMAGIIVYAVASPTYLAMFGFNGAEPQLLPACFAFGALLALNKHDVELNLRVMAGLLLFRGIFHNTPMVSLVFYAALFYGSLVVATWPPLARARMPGDFSYGIYLYGFPLQQLMVDLFPMWNAHRNQAASLAAALLAGACSWYLVERPAMRLGRHLIARSARFAMTGQEAPRVASMAESGFPAE